MLFPIEQFAMAYLQDANRKLGWSIRPFGMQSMNELQFLAFSSICDNCTLLSTWDFGVEELDEILAQRIQPPFAQINWTYNPAKLARALELSPEWLRPSLQQLVESLTPKKENEQKPPSAS
ncbi:hypothetical protein BG57_03995 [Caballeronia grimmiae]|uniref:Uncharacterized protein n=1 Tax=Caballeronia grimmiae TaxID=1071679 RepID=A0A069PBY7_9BURK|nr:hypothetical protein BG57_03995 [Caballeronia grimmiae]